jgi:RNA polymerase sigma factor (sigma-70 family)
LAGGSRAADPQYRLDPPDPAPDQLDALIQRELQQIVIDCLPALDADYRRVLKMRASGLKYGDIAERLGVSENTVATWVSRGIRTLGQCVRRRMQPRSNLVGLPEPQRGEP